MPSNKPKINSYLDNDELAALDKFGREAGYSRSQAVAHLIRNYLIENDEPLEVKEIEEGFEGRLKLIETGLDDFAVFNRFNAERADRQDKLIAELQEEVCRLKGQLKDKPPEVVTDDQVAAATGQPEWKVRHWRHGIAKPRGKRIKANLKPFVVHEGQWTKKA